MIRPPLKRLADRLGLAHPCPTAARVVQRHAHAASACDCPTGSYPVVCDTKTGQVHFDNYGGRWGEQRELDRFLQAYAVEKARIEARKLGHNVSEAQQTDGSIVLTINT